MYQSTRWKSTDLELLPDNGNRYEIIDGEFFVTRADNKLRSFVAIVAVYRWWSHCLLLIL